MNSYTDVDRKKDFDYFVSHYQDLFKQYGHKFLAIKNETVLGAYPSVSEAIEDLSSSHDIGTYIIQECTGEEAAYRATMMRLLIKG